MDLGPPISKEVQLISFHSVSKGYYGECGQRGGYFEMSNIPPEVCLFISCVTEFSFGVSNWYFKHCSGSSNLVLKFNFYLEE